MPQRATFGSWDRNDVLLGLMLGALLSFVAWMFSQQLEDRDFRAAGSRWTAADAASQERRLLAEIESKYPPAWLLTRIDDLVTEQKRLQCQIDRLEGNECILDGLDFHGVPNPKPRERIASRS